MHREQPAGPPAGKKLLHALGLLALALFLLYVAVQFVLIFHRSYKTETAIRYTLAESLNLTGVVAFDAVDVPGSGNLGYLVQDGERVTNGTVVAECYTDDTRACSVSVWTGSSAPSRCLRSRRILPAVSFRC